MSVVTDFFAATPDELASMAIDWGPMPPPPQPPKAKGGLFGFGRKQPVQDGPLDPRGPTLPTVESTSILTTQLGTLDQFVTGTPYDELEQSGKLHDIVRSSERKDGPVVFPVRRELRDGLANLPRERIPEVARQWGEDEEIGATDPEDFTALRGLILELSQLAQEAVASNRDLYLWASL